MANSEGPKFSLRVLIHKEKKKVLFAEVDRYFADTLLSFLTLPLGTIVRLLMKHYGDKAPVIGSLNTLYTGLENLDTSYFWDKAGKLMLLNPRNPFEAQMRKLKINIDNTEPAKFFVCLDCESPKSRDSVTANMCYNTGVCSCGRLMNREAKFNVNVDNVDNGIFTTETASFILSDDLQMQPNSTGFGLQILNSLCIDETYKVEEKIVVFGFEEVMDLLKGSLISKTPLTDLIFGKTNNASLVVKSEFGSFIGKNAANSTFKKMNVKALVQKSTGKFLLAQTSEGFVDFLYSFLTIPLGGVLSLLEGDSSFGSIHNLYKSRACLNSSRYLKTDNPLNKTYSPLMYLSKYSIYPVFEYSTTSLYCIINKWLSCCLYTTYPTTSDKGEKVHYVVLKNPKDYGSCIRGPAMFSVADDLVVKRMSAISTLSTLNGLQIPINDVEEHVIDVGIEEALSIFKASLFSTSALNNGLKSSLMRQPKKEK